LAGEITVHLRTLRNIKIKYFSPDGATKAEDFLCSSILAVYLRPTHFYIKTMGKISREDRVVIKALLVEKKWNSRRFLEDSRAKAGPEVASIDSSQKLIMDYQLTELLVAAV